MKKIILTIMTVVLLMTVIFMGCSKRDGENAGSSAEETDTNSEQLAINSQRPKDTPSLSKEVSVGYVYYSNDCDNMLINNAVQGLLAISSTPFSVTIIDAEKTDYDVWINEIVGAGCDIVFLSGIENEVAQRAATEHPEINFELYGANDITQQSNLASFYFRLYQQQYLNGMAAAYASQTGNIGYITDEGQSEDVRRVNAFALGAMFVNPDAIVHFSWTGSDLIDSFDIASELSKEGCDVIFKSQVDDGLLQHAKENDILLIGSCEDTYVHRAFSADATSYIVDRARAAVSISAQWAEDDYWIGMQEYQVDYIDYDFLNDEQIGIIKDAARLIAGGKWDVFTGPITDSYGNTIIPDGMSIPDEDLYYMLWYVQNIKAIAPPMG